MTTPCPAARFRKRYRHADTRRTAQANHRWLAGLGGPLRLPRLLAAGPYFLDFEFVSGRRATAADMTSTAEHLGDFHGHLHTHELHRARIDVPHVTDAGHRIRDFLTPRTDLLRQYLNSEAIPGVRLDLDQASRMLEEATDGPAALYKDTNPRNVIITLDGAVMVDVDDLTLAPFGYDLAKLVVTLTMTHGPIPRRNVEAALAAYNEAADRHRPGLGHVGWPDLMAWTEIHHILTSRYLGRGGYEHSWHVTRGGLVNPPTPIGGAAWP